MNLFSFMSLTSRFRFYLRLLVYKLDIHNTYTVIVLLQKDVLITISVRTPYCL